MAPGAGFEPAHDRINSAAPSQLGYPGKTYGREPGSRTQYLCDPNAADLPSSSLPKFENQNLAGPSGFEPESQPSEGWALSRWTMDRNRFGVAGGNRILVDGSTDRRLSTRPRPHLVPATPGELGGRGGNRTPICWLQASRPAVERLPQFLEPEGVVETPTSALRERRSSA